ncbi:MAG: radical SAM protein, partial [Muribaculaceae bacterium]|nr:radical SAM protein [Muribaculaceae bacterium]
MENIEIIQAPIFGISRHRLTTDGRGVTTLVTFHGCTLRCKYCLNPQCLKSDKNILYYTPQSLFDKVKKDDLYFRATGGGITFGGGEPCLQTDFILAFHRLCPSEWNLRLETALNVSPDIIDQLAPVIDEWIVDIKSLNPLIFKSYTGFDNTRRNASLERLLSIIPIDKIKLRIPIIPGYTTKEDAISDMEQLKNRGFSRFDIFQYVTVKPTHYSSLVPGLLPGKAKCEVMKRIRNIIAEANGLDKSVHICSHKGDCSGTCHLCEKELFDLTQAIYNKIKQNQSIC